MILANEWKDYEIIDTSNGEKLERWGNIVLRRPDPQIVWDTPKDKEWKRANAWYHRSESGGGRWEYRKFACGYETHYCPNFFKEQKNKSCASDPKIIERDKKRKEAKSALCSTIASLDVDNEYKDRLEGAIKYI